MSLVDKAKRNTERKTREQKQEEKSDLLQLFLHEKPVLALIAVKDSPSELYIRDVARIADTTYAHGVKQVNKLEDLGLLNTERRGRKKFVSTTENGEKVAEKLMELDELLDEVSEV
jgi:DNA-binding MarR family transcriptional regulator